MTRTTLIAGLVAGMALALLAGLGLPGAAAQDMPAAWAVTGVASNDVLHLRDVPSADSKSIGRIPHDARGLRHLGCRRTEMPFDQWVLLSKAARQAALMQWCRVEYRGQEGWVAGRFLKPDEAAKQ